MYNAAFNYYFSYPLYCQAQYETAQKKTVSFNIAGCCYVILIYK